MRKSLAANIALNRRKLLFLGVMLSLAGFGIFAWQTGAQRIAPELRIGGLRKPVVETQQRGAPVNAKQQRYLADREANATSKTVNNAVALAPLAAGNPVIFAYSETDDHLVSFNANTPGTFLTNIQINGLNTTDPSHPEVLAGMDFRPSNGLLYTATSVLSSISPNPPGRFASLDITTGNLAFIGATFAPPPDGFQGEDFNPVVNCFGASTPECFRNVGTAELNRRFNPTTGAITSDTALIYAAGDVNFGANPNIVHIAYSNNTPGATSTTLYAIDSNLDTLVRIGSVGGTSESPNTGLLHTIGPLGVNVTSFGGFDIQQGTNIAYAALNVASNPTLYRINLATGAASLVGAIGSAPAGTTVIDGLSIQFAANGGIADLSITKTDGFTTWTPGVTTSRTYTITVTNLGDDPVVGATVTDTLSAKFNPATSSWTCVGAGGGTCTASGTGSINDTAVNLPLAGSVTYTLIATIVPGSTGNLVNTATVATPAGVTDLTPANNTATDTDTLVLTAAGVTVSGQVLTPDGRGLRNAVVVITDSKGVARTVVTGIFGNYQFDDVQSGETYVIGVVSKRYHFDSRVLQVTDTLSGVNFIAQE